ncbi:DUF4157 domain-containing protein [Leptolyngbya sp. PCC 6406]|uniref:eCIS core domain-containing protein n=1 Tax=Leptolyngbya sp. PCC 6406 TaxID=1173264 RepID=UPI0002AC1E4F|nr:DUF4157 domain-containing protein [Leptolyngbya sp. PCC 6406]
MQSQESIKPASWDTISTLQTAVLTQRPFSAEHLDGSHPPNHAQGFELSQIPVSTPIQAKLTVGPVGDRYEQEADQVASQVVDRINSPAADAVQRDAQEEELQMKPMVGSLQREAVPEEEELQMKPMAGSLQRAAIEEEELLQGKSMDSSLQRAAIEEEELLQGKSLQRQGGQEAMTAPADVEQRIEQSRGQGQTLPSDIQGKMESAFGADFSGVRVHANSAESHQLNEAVGARAFTTGQDIFFRQGAYSPSDRGGQELLAHELTHVVQQNGATVQKRTQS